ncbi:hypothetical protein DFJ74DRAFT_660099 [Hyaloraphidium curvatum]|nr:hypothetical protein DFJ74DRAFT_660099 [Hyaloraphidium curvatum]
MSMLTENMARGPFPEESGIPRPTIQTLMFFDEGLPSRDEMAKLVEASILKFYRFKSIPALDSKGRWIWQEDPNFSLDDHLLEETVPDLPALHKFVESLFDGSEIDPDKPKWQFYLVKFEGTDRGAIVMNVDHVLGDGLSFVRLALEMVRDEKGDTIDFLNPAVASKGKSGSAAKDANGKKPTKIVKGIRGVTGALYLGYSLLTSHVKALATQLGPGDTKTLIKDEYAPYRFNQTRTTVYLPIISLEAVKKMKATTKEGFSGYTVNDVLTAVLAGAFRRYLLYREDPVLKSDESSNVQVRALLPFSFPRNFSDDDLHNQWCFISIPLPVGLATPAERLKSVNATMTGIKKSPDPLAFMNVQRLGMGVLPKGQAAQAGLESMTKHTMVFTNVPAMQEYVYLAGKKVTSIFPVISNIVPQISALSYAGQITINMVVDPEIIVDHEKLSDFFMEELVEAKDLMLGEAGKDVDVLFKKN